METVVSVESGLNAAKELLLASAKSSTKIHGKLQRSNSLPLRIGDTSIKYFDDKNFQIIISSPDPPFRNTEASNSAAVADIPFQGETETGVKITTPQDHDHEKSSLKRDLYKFALQDDWEKAKIIFESFPEIVRIPLTASGDTALHVAVSANNINFVQQLLKRMKPQDMEMTNKDGNTAFCMAAILGNRDCLQIMTQENENLPFINGNYGMLPVQLAALNGHHNILEDLTHDELLKKMTLPSIEVLFLMTIKGSMYDVAVKLFGEHPFELANARDDEELTALHLLARKPPGEYYYMHEKNYKGQPADLVGILVKEIWAQVKLTGEENNNKPSSQRADPSNLLDKLWTQVRQLGDEKMLDFIGKPSSVLFDAVKSGNTDVVKWILHMNPELLKIKDFDGRSLLHSAALHRQKSIFDLILQMKTSYLLISALDINMNNVLHCAAQYQNKATAKLRPYFEMQSELEWFEEVENKLPRQLRTMKNKEGETPKDIFYAEHRKLSKEARKEAKGMGDTSMIVAVLIVTVAFAAFVTVPGDKANNWFIVFMLANGVALLSSSTSIICFIFIFTSSRSKESKYITSMHPTLNYGLDLVGISIAAMIMAFAAAYYLIFEHNSKWVAYVMTALCFYPIQMFLLFPFFDDSDALTDNVTTLVDIYRN